VDGWGRKKIPKIGYRRAGDVSNFVIRPTFLEKLGTSATHLVQIAGLIWGIWLVLSLLVQFGPKKQTSPTVQCFDFIALK
jgi:hypothetical protein